MVVIPYHYIHQLTMKNSIPKWGKWARTQNSQNDAWANSCGLVATAHLEAKTDPRPNYKTLHCAFVMVPRHMIRFKMECWKFLNGKRRKLANINISEGKFYPSTRSWGRFLPSVQSDWKRTWLGSCVRFIWRGHQLWSQSLLDPRRSKTEREVSFSRSA